MWTCYQIIVLGMDGYSGPGADPDNGQQLDWHIVLDINFVGASAHLGRIVPGLHAE